MLCRSNDKNEMKKLKFREGELVIRRRVIEAGFLVSCEEVVFITHIIGYYIDQVYKLFLYKTVNQKGNTCYHTEDELEKIS